MELYFHNRVSQKLVMFFSMFYLRIFQYGGFIGAQITNSTLLFLIYTRAEQLFGNYRHVMCTFALYSLIYSWIEILTQPVMHIKGPVFVVYMDSPLKYEKWIGNNLTCLYCGSFALCISLLAAQFFYRYIAVCRPHNLRNFEGKKLSILFIPCIICFILWFSFVYFGMYDTVEKQEFLKDVLEEYYDEDSSKVSYIAPMYWSVDEKGQKLWNVGELMSSIGCTCIILVCFSTIVKCAYETFRRMKESKLTMSKRTKELNRQLFITLGFQTILPLFMMYSPVGLLITFPMIGLEAGRLANFTGASLGVYPALEPLIAIFLIRDFRQTVLCQKRRGQVTTISTAQALSLSGRSRSTDRPNRQSFA